MNDDVTKYPSQKKTKDFCNGKEGKEHKPKVFEQKRAFVLRYLELCCETCGKVLHRWYKFPKGAKKPDWVKSYLEAKNERK